MPTVSIYIRKDDYSKYLSIYNPSEFIHNALNQEWEFDTKEPMVLKDVLVKPIKTRTEIVREIGEKIIKPQAEIDEINAKQLIGKANAERQPIPKSFSARKKK